MAGNMGRVWNDGLKPYSEQFKDGLVTIQPKSYVEMEEHDAHLFLGQFTGIKRDGTGADKITKPLRYERLKVDEKEVSPACNVCKKEFQTWELVAQHGNLEHADLIIKDKEHKKSKLF